MRSKASNMEELAETQKSLAADEAYLAELNQSCSVKAKEWAARQKQASEEQAAIEKAKEILTEGSPRALRATLVGHAAAVPYRIHAEMFVSAGRAPHALSPRLPLPAGVKAFLQVSSHHRNKVDDVKLTQVSKLLKALSMKNHKSYALAQLAASAQSDTFAKVRGAQGEKGTHGSGRNGKEN